MRNQNGPYLKKQQFIDNLKKLNLVINDNHIGMMEDARFYCAQNVVILDEGYLSFREVFLSNVNLLSIDIDTSTI